MMNSVAPVWDGNETWLVLGGGGLFAVFPLAYAVVMPALYAPIIVMLLGLVFRGVAFEFGWKTQRAKYLWDWAFAGGSLAAALAQGIALGALVQGIPVAESGLCRRLVGLADAVQRVDGRRAGPRLRPARRHLAGDEDRRHGAAARLWLARTAGIGTLLLIGAVSLWTPFLDPVFMERWLGWPQILYSAPVPLVVLVCCLGAVRRPRQGPRDCARSWRRWPCS